MKNKLLLGIHLTVGLLLIILSSAMQLKETEVNITGIRSPKGNIILNVFKDNAGYDNEKPYKKFTFDKKAMVDGTLTVTCKIGEGVYGITLLDDENGNGKIDRNFIRMPKEGFGFSNFFMEKLKKPAFDDFKVDLTIHPKVGIKVKYM
ncbi:DUF2141 domain-containing protein [Mucilaginibacter sp. SP1R1]|uniref:DUF2141 domain-containing protein n=1 Tax=Mucilaginibacter sp. SP1R1 TaxID=2723091 RepID=UPI001609AF23|nr:DUF2141 domain-containing protein [Mucilaginibacter sp. SP1R1]MBB6148036.1 uncharacterized protein (DUF2141 family) [Mucilaginibacter sp. SP1R1]